MFDEHFLVEFLPGGRNRLTDLDENGLDRGKSGVDLFRQASCNRLVLILRHIDLYESTILQSDQLGCHSSNASLSS